MGTFSALQFTAGVFLIRRSTRPLPGSAVAQIAEVEMTAKLNLGPVLSVLPHGASALHIGQETCFLTSRR